MPAKKSNPRREMSAASKLIEKAAKKPVIRLGLCCLFKDTPIKFRTFTVKHLKQLDSVVPNSRFIYIAEVLSHNTRSLQQAITFCALNDIGSFRISSQIFPCYTHPEVGYTLDDLGTNKDQLLKDLQQCKELATKFDVRLTMHPDQFVVLNSPTPAVVANSIKELEYQAMFAQHVGVDVINIHGGGVYGDKVASLKRLGESLKLLSTDVLSRLTFENDDKSYTPEDLLPICVAGNVPLLYDVHHHRCTHKDKKNLAETEISKITETAFATWCHRGEQLMHISSPKYGWTIQPNIHHDFINYERDFPQSWIKNLSRNVTIDIEAKSKERAVIRLRDQLRKSGVNVWTCPSPPTDPNLLKGLEKWPVVEKFSEEDDEVDVLVRAQPKNKKKVKKDAKVDNDKCDEEDVDETPPKKAKVVTRSRAARAKCSTTKL